MSAIISFVGRLTKDAETKTIGSNNALAFSAAVDSGYGEKKTTTFYNCTYFKKSEGIAPYMLKGTQVFVTGDLSMRTWTNKEGKEITSPSVNVSVVELVGNKPAGTASDSKPASAPAKKPASKAAPAEVPEDEEAPF